MARAAGNETFSIWLIQQWRRGQMRAEPSAALPKALPAPRPPGIWPARVHAPCRLRRQETAAGKPGLHLTYSPIICRVRAYQQEARRALLLAGRLAWSGCKPSDLQRAALVFGDHAESPNGNRLLDMALDQAARPPPGVCRRNCVDLQASLQTGPAGHRFQRQ